MHCHSMNVSRVEFRKVLHVLVQVPPRTLSSTENFAGTLIGSSIVALNSSSPIALV
jgi:hypothetical protein